MRKVLLGLSLIWMAFIFYCTHQNADAIKDTAVTVVVNVNSAVNENEQLGFFQLNENQLLSIFYFLEYFILGALVFLTLFTGKYTSVIVSVIICVLYSISDQCHLAYILHNKMSLNNLILNFSGALLVNLILVSVYIVISKLDLTRPRFLFETPHEEVNIDDFKTNDEDIVEEEDSPF